MDEYDSSKQINKPQSGSIKMNSIGQKSIYSDNIISTSPAFSTNISQEAFFSTSPPKSNILKSRAEAFPDYSLLSTSENSSSSFPRARYSTFSPFKSPSGDIAESGLLSGLKLGTASPKESVLASQFEHEVYIYENNPLFKKMIPFF